VEPEECATLTNNGRGTHRIEGIGDKMVPLIHNVLTTDYVAQVHDDDCVMGLQVLEHGRAVLQKRLHLAAGSMDSLGGWFGISSVCNILGAIKTARILGLGAQDNVVTVATDGFDRYPSVIADLARRRGPIGDSTMAEWFEQIFRGGGASATNILDVRSGVQKERLFRQKREVWKAFGYSDAHLEKMKSQSFWDAEYGKIAEIDAGITAGRKLPGA